jgi:hypothetical protein
LSFPLVEKISRQSWTENYKHIFPRQHKQYDRPNGNYL